LCLGYFPFDSAQLAAQADHKPALMAVVWPEPGLLLLPAFNSYAHLSYFESLQRQMNFASECGLHLTGTGTYAYMARPYTH